MEKLRNFRKFNETGEGKKEKRKFGERGEIWARRGNLDKEEIWIKG